jgi:hypothetical protein
MNRILVADMDAVVLSALGLLVAAGIVLHVWGRLDLARVPIRLRQIP